MVRAVSRNHNKGEGANKKLSCDSLPLFPFKAVFIKSNFGAVLEFMRTFWEQQQVGNSYSDRPFLESLRVPMRTMLESQGIPQGPY